MRESLPGSTRKGQGPEPIEGGDRGYRPLTPDYCRKRLLEFEGACTLDKCPLACIPGCRARDYKRRSFFRSVFRSGSDVTRPCLFVSKWPSRPFMGARRAALSAPAVLSLFRTPTLKYDPCALWEWRSFMGGRSNSQSTVRLDQGGRDAFQRFLALGDPAAIVSALSAGDPLGLATRSALRVREHAYLIDADRLCHQSIARVAFGATPDPVDDIEQWLSDRIDEAIEDLLEQDREEARSETPQLHEWDSRYEFLTMAMGIQPGSTRAAAVAFNGLPGDNRQAFFALIFAEKTPEQCIEEGYGERDDLREKVLHCFWTLFGAEENPRRRT